MPPPEEKREQNIHRVFEVGVVLKGLNAVLEIALGLLLFFVNVSDIVQAFIENQLVEDPNDFLARHLQPFTAHLTSGSETFAALYLFSHGAIKIVLVWGLLRNKAWAYPASLAVLALFVAYQGIKFLENHSIALVLLTLFDLALMWLIYHEYRRISRAAI